MNKPLSSVKDAPYGKSKISLSEKAIAVWDTECRTIERYDYIGDDVKQAVKEAYAKLVTPKQRTRNSIKELFKDKFGFDLE